MAAPHPKPLAIRELEGFAGHHPINKDEPKFQKISYTPPPKNMAEQGKIVWNELMPVLTNCGVLTPADIPLFTRYCETTAKWRRALSIINEDGTSIVTKNGTLVVHPESKNFQNYSTQLLQMEIQLGMTPSSRTKVVALADNDTIKDDFDD